VCEQEDSPLAEKKNRKTATSSIASMSHHVYMKVDLEISLFQLPKDDYFSRSVEDPVAAKPGLRTLAACFAHSRCTVNEP
jgi:hypothetical protein